MLDPLYRYYYCLYVSGYCIVLESLVNQRNKIIKYMLLNQNGLPLSYRNITGNFRKPFEREITV